MSFGSILDWFKALANAGSIRDVSEISKTHVSELEGKIARLKSELGVATTKNVELEQKILDIEGQLKDLEPIDQGLDDNDIEVMRFLCESQKMFTTEEIADRSLLPMIIVAGSLEILCRRKLVEEWVNRTRWKISPDGNVFMRSFKKSKVHNR